jgi:hypothetical protein
MAINIKARTPLAAAPALYEADFHRWSADQARALRDRRPDDIDWENIAEEIESLGRSDRQEIASRLTVILAHLLKWQIQPLARSNSWRATLVEQRTAIADIIADSPSLAPYPASILDRRYEAARKRASADAGLPLDAFPETSPYTVEQALDPDYVPAARPDAA